MENISKIIVLDARPGSYYATAEVVFEPPPKTELWGEDAAYRFKTADGMTCNIRFKLHPEQRQDFLVKSPSNFGKTYNARLHLTACQMGFGILTQPNEMTVMQSITPTTERSQADGERDIGLVLNLHRREIEIHFPVLLRSENEDRTRLYRFPISFDNSPSVWQVENDKTAEDLEVGVQYVFHLENPPWYSRQLITQLLGSHSAEGKRWIEDDTWTRQTDIVAAKDDFQHIDQTPVCLRKNTNRINIGRWTTFVLHFSRTSDSVKALNEFQQALPDFNIPISKVTGFTFKTISPATEAPYWSLFKSSSHPPGVTPSLHVLHEKLSFDVLYQLEVCISKGYLSEYAIDAIFLEKLASLNAQKAVQTLRHVDSNAERIFDPTRIFSDIKYKKPVRVRQLPSNCVELQHVSVTATTLKMYSPTAELSNRIVRMYKHYASHFLRVHFEDDDYRGQTTIYASNATNKMELILRRIKRAMLNGIVVAGRHFDFLAWGNSQLREHGAYFFAPVPNGPNAQSIRAQMGEFDNEKVVAKRAARMGQCFSTTQPIAWNPKGLISQNQMIPDVVNNGYNFTDGVGKISELLAQTITSSLRIAGHVPSAFQFRMGGCKGIVALDPELGGLDLKLRGSQFKFASESKELEIIRWSEFWQPFLNRQLILVMSELGVPDKVFIDMQNEAVARLGKAMMDDATALSCLRDNVDPNRMTLTLCDLVAGGFRRVEEPFVTSLLKLWQSHSLKYIKEKAKLPISKGAFLLGTTDETNTLRGHYNNLQVPDSASREDKQKGLPEIFVQYTSPHTGNRVIVEGVCLIARNPSLHKGDVRVVRAVNAPTLHHLCDVLVMPQNGDRDLPSMCSGGDLDGDDYIVIWDEKLLPQIWNVEPFHYQPPEPKVVDFEITTNDIIEFFLDYLRNDLLGRIAHAHMGAADLLEEGLESSECIEMVQLHSMAVDYAKTGVPASLPRRLERTKWPHYMEKRGYSYRSHKILGQLYDAIGSKKMRFKPGSAYKFDERILKSTVVPTGSMKTLKAQAAALKDDFDLDMQRIMSQHSIKTDLEVWSTFVMDHSKKSSEYKFHEEIGQLSRALKEQYHQAIVETVGGNDYDSLAPFAVAAYTHTAEQVADVLELRSEMEKDGFQKEEMPKTPFCSFPWLLSDVLSKIATDTETNWRLKQNAPELLVDEQTSTAGKSTVRTEMDLRAPRNPVEQATSTKSSVCGKIRGANIGDPFGMIDPFAKAQKPKDNSGSDTDSFVHVSKDSSVADSGSPIQLLPSEYEDVTILPTRNSLKDGDPATSPAFQSVDGDTVDEKATTKIELDGLFSGGGVMKDPALMTEAEKAALFGDDNDDDD